MKALFYTYLDYKPKYAQTLSMYLYVFLLSLCTQIRITYVCTYRDHYVSLTDNLPHCPNQFYIAFYHFIQMLNETINTRDTE